MTEKTTNDTPARKKTKAEVAEALFGDKPAPGERPEARPAEKKTKRSGGRKSVRKTEADDGETERKEPSYAVCTYRIEDVMMVLRVLGLIPQNRWITIPEISQALTNMGFPTHVRKLQRIMKVLREHPDLFPIRFRTNSRPHGFQWDSSGRGFHFPVLEAGESLLLRLAEEHLRNQLPASVLAGLKPLFRDARVSLARNGGSRTASWLRKVKVVSPAQTFMPPKVQADIFETVTEALLNDQRLAVSYRNARNNLVGAIVKPLGLVQQDVRTYLVCQFEKYSDYRHLALHRIEVARAMDDRFERPEDFDLDAYVNAAPFNYASGRTIALEIVTDDPVFVKNLLETPFNPTQRITPATLVEDGRDVWRLEVDIEDSLLLDGWLAMRRNSILSTKKTTISRDDGIPDRETVHL